MLVAANAINLEFKYDVKENPEDGSRDLSSSLNTFFHPRSSQIDINCSLIGGVTDSAASKVDGIAPGVVFEIFVPSN